MGFQGCFYNCNDRLTRSLHYQQDNTLIPANHHRAHINTVFVRAEQSRAEKSRALLNTNIFLCSAKLCQSQIVRSRRAPSSAGWTNEDIAKQSFLHRTVEYSSLFLHMVYGPVPYHSPSSGSVMARPPRGHFPNRSPKATIL